MFGAGSLGSVIAETLVRNGVSALHVVDPDDVEAVNLSRTAYTFADIGRPKVEALTQQLLSINPLATVTTTRGNVDDATVADCESIIAWADLVVAVTDDPRAQVILDVLSHEADKPATFAGVLPGGHTGEIVISLPGATTCYRCAAGNLRLLGPAGDKDYATGRLTGAVALGADVTMVAHSAAKVALDLLGLVHGADTSLLKPIVEHRTMVHVGLAPHALEHVEVLSQLPHQHMLQTVWMLTEASPECEHCPSAIVGEDTPEPRLGISLRASLLRWIRSASRLRRSRAMLLAERVI